MGVGWSPHLIGTVCIYGLSIPPDNPSPDITPFTTLSDIGYFCSPSGWGPQRPTGQGRHGNVRTCGRHSVLRARIFSGVLVALSPSPFLIQFSLLPDVQGATPDQISSCLPIPCLCWDLYGGPSCLCLPATVQMVVRHMGIMNGVHQSPAGDWGHAVSSQAQGLLSFHCVTF